METVGSIIKRGQLGISSQNSSPKLITVENDGTNAITAYRGELKQETVAKNVAKIKAAFPALMPDFFKLLIERLREKGFTDERLNDAVNNVIDNCQYPTPTLANFLSFDKRIKVLNYDELCNLIYKHEASFESYSRIIINGKNFWIRKADKELYNLPDSL